MSSAVPRQLVLACAFGLLALGATYQIKGNVDLIGSNAPGAAVDLKNRDMEQALFMDGKDPYDFMIGSQPPWGYQFGQLLVWPDWPMVRTYFAVINFAALAFLMAWAYRAPREASPETRLLLMASVFAFGGSCTATEVGQVSIIVTALLAGALWCDRNRRQALCGVLVALSLIKPTIAVPFAVALIAVGRFRAAASAAAYGAAATAVTWFVTGASPLEMLREMATAAAGFVHDGTIGLVDVAAMAGTSPAAAVWLPLLIAVPGFALMVSVRPSLHLAFAIAALWGRLWTYHKSYDDVMLVFVMVPLGAFALGKVPSRSALAAFAAMGLLAWIPGQLLALPEVQMLQLAVWPIGLAVLVALNRRAERAVTATPRHAQLEHLHA